MASCRSSRRSTGATVYRRVLLVPSKDRTNLWEDISTHGVRFVACHSGRRVVRHQAAARHWQCSSIVRLRRYDDPAAGHVGTDVHPAVERRPDGVELVAALRRAQAQGRAAAAGRETSSSVPVDASAADDDSQAGCQRAARRRRPVRVASAATQRRPARQRYRGQERTRSTRQAIERHQCRLGPAQVDSRCRRRQLPT